MGKVIDLTTRLKTLAPTQQSYTGHAAPKTEVVDYDERKQKILFSERRQIKRTILTEFVSAMVVLPEKGLLKVAIYDISEEGISFDIEIENGQFKAEEEVSMRVYLNQKTYFPITIQIKHVTEELGEGVIRHGSVFMRGSSTDAALQYFVRFIESVSVGLKKDEGDLMAPKIS
jgi:PilZ domain